MLMNPRSLMLIVVALVLAGSTAMMARNWLRAERTQVVVGEPVQNRETQVLVAAVNLPTGRILKEGDLRWQDWPEDAVVPTYVVRGRRSLGDFYGAVIRHSLVAGSPVTEQQVVKPGARGFMAAVLTPGMRAVSVPISATSGIAGFVFPGDRVDLILSHELKTGEMGGRHAGETVLTNVRVLAIDQRMNDQNNAPTIGKTATLEVTPKQAEKIAVLRQLGSLSLSLRSLAKTDRDRADGQGLDDAKPRPGRTYTLDTEVSRLLSPVAGRGRFTRVEVARGNEVSAINFESVKP